jgi:protein TonB
VDGNQEQRSHERGIRRRSMILSGILQTVGATALVLIPLFGKPARLAMAIVTPVSPYRHTSGTAHQTPRPRTEIRHVCTTCVSLPPSRITASSQHELNSSEEPSREIGEGEIPGGVCPTCLIGGTEQPRRPISNDSEPEKRRIVKTTLDPAMLIHRVEPLYPILAKQVGRAGRVELRAIIATDGTIQSLQIVGGDPLFFQSAREAVLQWRYRPTVLNGRAVEIDTFITVIYNMDRR